MINWITPKSSRSATEYVAAGIFTIKSREIEVNHVCLRFSPEAQKDLRLIYGDRLVIGFDDVSKKICFKRVTGNGGHKLTYASGTKRADAEASGKDSILVIQVSVDRPAIKTIQYSANEVKIEGTHVSISAPEFFN